MRKKTFVELVPDDMLCNNCKLRIGKIPHKCPLGECFGDDDLCNCCDFCSEKCHNET